MQERSNAEDSNVVIGIDPGLTNTGWAVLSNDPLAVEDCGVISTTTQNSLAERLQIIYRSLQEVIQGYTLDAAAVEGLFYRPGLPKTALLLAHARGAILLALTAANAPVFEYPASEVRKALGVSGSADKERTRRMVESILGKPLPAPDHIWDATALAICHILRSRNPISARSRL